MIASKQKLKTKVMTITRKKNFYTGVEKQFCSIFNQLNME
jgi:hypothetical protein